MSLLIVLPRERALLAPRRFEDKADNNAIMHALDSDVFHYLCAKTDWASGRIGQHSALSYARIALALTEDIPRKPSRSLRKVSRNDVRNSVKRLVRVGLFSNESVSTEKQHTLILHRPFWQALLRVEQSKNNPDTQQMSGFMSQLLKNEVFNNNNLATSSMLNSQVKYAPDAIYNTISIINRSERSFRMHLKWQPERKFVDLFLQASGFSGSDIKKIWFGKYVQYWTGEPITRTQREWSAHFANHMQGYLLRPNYFEKVNGMLDEEKTTPVKRLRIPMKIDAESLQEWALDQGLPIAPAGFSAEQYRQLLRSHVERMNNGQERQSERCSPRESGHYVHK